MPNIISQTRQRVKILNMGSRGETLLTDVDGHNTGLCGRRVAPARRFNRDYGKKSHRFDRWPLVAGGMSIKSSAAAFHKILQRFYSNSGFSIWVISSGNAIQRVSLKRFRRAPMSGVPRAWLKNVRGEKSRWKR